MPKITTLSKLWIPTQDKLPEFNQTVALYLNVSADPKTPDDHYDYGQLKSVTMTGKGKEVLFLNREGKDVAASHWLYLVPPSKEQAKEANKEGK